MSSLCHRWSFCPAMTFSRATAPTAPMSRREASSLYSRAAILVFSSLR